MVHSGIRCSPIHPMSNLDGCVKRCQLAIWLHKKIGIPLGNATTYSKGFVSLGLDSPNALIHDALVEDLHTVGMSVDHQQCLLRAIGNDSVLMSSESPTSNYNTISPTSTSLEQLRDFMTMPGAPKIPVLRCRKCTVTCEDDNGTKTPYIVEPGHSGFMICTMPDSRSMNSTPNLSHDKLNIDAKEEVVLQSPPTISNFVTDPLQWSVDEVSAWVESTLGFEGPKYATCFLKAAIDGRTLLSMVSEVDFKAIGILNSTNRKILLQNLYKLRHMRRTQNRKGIYKTAGSSSSIVLQSSHSVSLYNNVSELKSLDLDYKDPIVTNQLSLDSDLSYSTCEDMPSNDEDKSNSRASLHLSTSSSHGSFTRNVEELNIPPHSPIIAQQPVNRDGVDTSWPPSTTTTGCFTASLPSTGGGNGSGGAVQSSPMEMSRSIYVDSTLATPVQNHGGKHNYGWPSFDEENKSKSRQLTTGRSPSSKSPHSVFSTESTPQNLHAQRRRGSSNWSSCQHTHMLWDKLGSNKPKGSGFRTMMVQPQLGLKTTSTTNRRSLSDGHVLPRSSTEFGIATAAIPTHLELPRMSNDTLESSYTFACEGTKRVRDVLLRTDGSSVAPSTRSPCTNLEDIERSNLAVVDTTDKSVQISTGSVNHGMSFGSSKPPSTPRQLCNCTLLLDELGRGASGIVYRALHVPSLRIVAVKSIALSEDENRNQAVREICAMHDINRVQLEPVDSSSPFSTGGFVSPASQSDVCQASYDCVENGELPSDYSMDDNTGALNLPKTHPHIVAFYDAYIDPEKECMCILLEQMEAGTLQCAVNAGRALSEDELAVVSCSVLKGLSRMHAKKKIHRDIKPSNILLDRNGKVKISDFGVVRELTSSVSVAKTFTGTLCYMSPERILGEDYKYSSDIWSLGLVLVTLARGAFPFTGAGYWDILLAVQESPPPRLPEGTYSTEACNFVACMLRHNPAERHTADQLLNHPFIKKHKDQNCVSRLVRELMPLADAQQNSVNRSLDVENILSRLVEYEAEVAIHEFLYKHEKVAMVQQKMPPNSAEDQQPLKLKLHHFHRSAFRTLAQQLQTSNKELVDTYSRLVIQAEYRCNKNLKLL